MKKGEIYEGVITDFDFPNKGSLYIEDRKVIVKETLPGQKVRFSISKKKAGMAEGRLIEVIERSKLEDCEPACAYFGVCGGCAYQTLSYENQLNFKEEMVKKLIDKALPDADYIWEGILASPKQNGYRNKMEFTFGDEYKDGPLALGLHKKGSFHDIVSVCGNEIKEGCEIINSDWRKIVNYTLKFFSERNVPFYHRMKHEGILRNLVVRQSEATGEFLVNLVTSTQWSKYGYECDMVLAEYKDGLIALETSGSLAEGGRIAGILYTENDTLGDVVKSDRTIYLYGCNYITEEVMGLKFKISPFSFFQTNTKGCEVLYEKAREYIYESGSFDENELNGTSGKVVFDLYSGTGTIAQMMAKVSKKVIGIEIVEEAVEAAKENAGENGLDNCKFIAGDVLKAIDLVPDKPDLIIVDPPRDGINPKALDKILNFGVNQIVYISCKPTSLARDLKIMNERGYKLVKACCVDQFPCTRNVESCVLLERVSNRKADSYVKLNVKMEDYYRIKDAEGGEADG
ncbi:MAG: 23S rRNA (uracil(1939)-C(5))-methyltransferase RlmD [Lachnospiraceae bacterium]|nr:23S rRNA (uracil(1939)-C(5))-methyltransferase RlmD [Lachnospiraceae bacterium]